MSLFIGTYYILQFSACIGVVNFYGDSDRFTPCKDGQLPLDAASVFDSPLLVLGIYHIIEWIKTTFLLTAVCVNLSLAMYLYYLLSFNTLYGVIAIVYTMIVVFSEEGQECAYEQVHRGTWLKVEIIAFWVLFFLYPGPILPLRFCSKESHDEILNKKDDGSGSDEDDD